MHNKVDFMKATIIGGIFFLIPLAVVVVLVGKLVHVMKGVVGSLAPLLPVEPPIGALRKDLGKKGILQGQAHAQSKHPHRILVRIQRWVPQQLQVRCHCKILGKLNTIK